MSISFSWLNHIMEEKVSQLFDEIIEHRYTKKEEMIKAWNSLSGEKKEKEKIEKCTEYSNEKCTFVITRGEKMGERCTSRAKKDTLFCVKHTKDTKDKKEEKEEKKEVEETNQPKNELEFMTSSHRIELKKKVKTKKVLTFEVVHGFKIIKDTMIVVNDSNEMIGYLQDDKLIHSTTFEYDKFVQLYDVKVNRDGWKDIDE